MNELPVILASVALLSPVAWVPYLGRKLTVIHTLVNSNMTAHMQSELDATVRELAMMREVARLHEDAGRDPNEETISAIELTDKKVAELRAVLGDRFRVQEEVAG